MNDGKSDIVNGTLEYIFNLLFRMDIHTARGLGMFLLIIGFTQLLLIFMETMWKPLFCRKEIPEKDNGANENKEYKEFKEFREKVEERMSWTRICVTILLVNTGLAIVLICDYLLKV